MESPAVLHELEYHARVDTYLSPWGAIDWTHDMQHATVWGDP